MDLNIVPICKFEEDNDRELLLELGRYVVSQVPFSSLVLLEWKPFSYDEKRIYEINIPDAVKSHGKSLDDMEGVELYVISDSEIYVDWYENLYTNPHEFILGNAMFAGVEGWTDDEAGYLVVPSRKIFKEIFNTLDNYEYDGLKGVLPRIGLHEVGHVLGIESCRTIEEDDAAGRKSKSRPLESYCVMSHLDSMSTDDIDLAEAVFPLNEPTENMRKYLDAFSKQKLCEKCKVILSEAVKS